MVERMQETSVVESSVVGSIPTEQTEYAAARSRDIGVPDKEESNSCFTVLRHEKFVDGVLV